MVHPQSLGKVVFDLPEGRAGREDGLMELGGIWEVWWFALHFDYLYMGCSGWVLVLLGAYFISNHCLFETRCPLLLYRRLEVILGFAKSCFVMG